MKLFFNFLVVLFIVGSIKLVGSEEIIKTYSVSTKGIKIGELVWKLNKNNNKYENKILLKSKGFLSSVYSFSGEYLSFGTVENDVFVPEQYSHTWITKNKKKEMLILFTKNKVSKTSQSPLENEFSRINLFSLKDYNDPLTSFINIFNNQKLSKTVDGRRVYNMVVKDGSKKPNRKTIFVEDYINIYADHKRNDLEYLQIFKDESSVLPKKINIKFKGSVFSLIKI